MIDSKVGAIDAVDDVISMLRGSTTALTTSAYADDLSAMVTFVLDSQIDRLRELAVWIEKQGE